MIQRIQSILLFLVAICMFLIAAVLPIWGAENDTKHIELFAKSMSITENGTTTSFDNPIAILILAVIAGIVALFSIFQFKNRLLQMKLGALNSLLIGLTVAAQMYYTTIGGKEFEETPATAGGYSIGFFMPVIALLFNLVANRFIRKDEKLVKDADRLR